MNQVFDRIGEYNEIIEEDDSSPSPNSNQTNKKIRKVWYQDKTWFLQCCFDLIKSVDQELTVV